MRVKEQLLTLKAYVPGKNIEEVKREYGLSKIVKLASNENPFGCSKRVTEALASLSTQYALYPDGAAFELREKVAAHLHVKPEQLLFGSGLDEVIQMVSRALLEKGTNVVMANPTFSQYYHHAVIEGAEVREVPLKDGIHDLDTMLKQIDEQTQIVWICNPNNPTGTYVEKQKLLSFLEAVPKSTLVIMDEAYYEYAGEKEYPQTLLLLEEYENLMVLRTFSKAYGLAAFRIGYAVGNEKLIQQLEVARLPFNTSAVAQAVGLVAIEDQEFLQECVKQNAEGLNQYYTFCKEYDVFYYPSQTNFIFLKLGIPGNEAFERLMRKGYIVRSGAAFGLPDGIRITVGLKEENDEIIELLTELVKEQKKKEETYS
ncbi:histidinol-phosphate transaminase [Bacillus pseudomycoides]|uniref:Histidinol-phosphate aminotransferase n=1 Tax=Bacillus pseudomycoides TaxID=64104 RepID=A0ABD6T8T6_9BACI|nr:histidinol-phosphate transaminase [Bacillus pseudomycoides]PEK38954.1 histidinol-phosphate transaminase [Bacillus pseudomycoides]PEK63719.1 histidinol-phosphate transaminase [Bacillus pseudomycoides]PEP39703.1 histidinol-phosphate transaminase [Bacillus pseudomycoides]PEP41667.1 histidinol-phosphate transaminase [Bacillus pseudomycoides]PEP86505.1 histidinol-phosphate transaminase [Bacillus pseudomycoides]